MLSAYHYHRNISNTAWRQFAPRFPKQFLIASLTEIMKNNIFQFGDTFWCQIRGTAMGTSRAVNYAVLYVALLETHILLKKYQSNLLFLKRFIDNIIGVWIETQNPNAWEDFQTDLNNFGSLKWTCEKGLVNRLVFLDFGCWNNTQCKLPTILPKKWTYSSTSHPHQPTPQTCSRDWSRDVSKVTNTPRATQKTTSTLQSCWPNNSWRMVGIKRQSQNSWMRPTVCLTWNHNISTTQNLFHNYSHSFSIYLFTLGDSSNRQSKTFYKKLLAATWHERKQPSDYIASNSVDH
jgi:hypothetical protein